MACYLVTGASGYIGSKLIQRLLAENNKILFLTRRPPKVPDKQIVYLPATNSISDYRGAIVEHNVQAILHLASKAVFACPEDELKDLIDTNVTLGTLLFQAAVDTPCRRFVNVGTYWQNFDGAVFNPNCLYAATKQSFMDIATYYANWKGFSCISLKLTDVYGPDDPRKKIFSLVKQSFLLDKELHLTSGEQLVSFLYVDDAVSALCQALIQTKKLSNIHKIYTIATKPVRLRDAVELYIKIKKMTPHLSWGVIPYQKEQIMVPWIGEGLPNWRPTLSLEDGLKKL